MFSSNHILTVTGCLNHSDDLYNALKFGLKSSGELEYFIKNNQFKCVYQIVNDKYCIGLYNDMYKIPEGWNEFSFDFDLEIISKIISQHINKFPMPLIGEMGCDGSCEKGFVMYNIDHSFGSNESGIKNRFHGIVSFEPYTCFFAK